MSIPQKIPKIYKEAYKQYQDKDYGVGKYKYLYEYCHHKDLDIEDYSQMGLDKKASSQYQFVLLAPAKANKILVEFANGLDSIIESKDREQNLETLLTLKLINGGYKEKYWNFDERIEECTQENCLQTDIGSKESKATQENKHKQILEIYFSYGEGCGRLQEDSRHSSDVNLHIITQGYENGEEVELLIKTSSDEFSLQGKINNNKATLYDIFKDRDITIGEVEVYG